MNIYERIKCLRKTLGLTQTLFALKLGMTMQGIQRWESAKVEIKESSLMLIQQVYNVNPSWLREGVGEMFVEKETTVPIAPAPDEPFSRVKTFAYSAIRNMSDAEVQDLLKYIEDQKILKEHRQAKKENAG